jgi:ABC-2 type transport system ATP-binding protein
MANTIITVNNLVKNYGQFQAVKGISFDVNEGEIFGLLGPNGAGKSTTLEIIETLRPKTSGKIVVDGFDLDKSTPGNQKNHRGTVAEQWLLSRGSTCFS